MNIYEKMFASYLGFAIGDALGATTEFMLPREIKATYDIHKKIIGGGWLHLKPGHVTDDTEMCIALSDSIIESGGYNVYNTADAYVNWMKSKPVDIGNTVRKGLRDYIRTGEPRASESEFSAGNGALMRILPAFIYCYDHWESYNDIVLSQARITHNNYLSDVSCIVMGEMLKALIDTENILSALDIVSEFIKKEPSFSHSQYKGEASGYVKDTFRTVNHFFFDSSSFEEVLIRVVNQGGDADTNGAIAGMLAGALYGLEAIPQKWIKALNKDVYNKIEDQVHRILSTPFRVIAL